MTATVRNLRYNFPAVLKQLKKGQEVAITLRGKPVATLIPAQLPTARTVHWPDLTGRLIKIRGRRPFDAVGAILRQRAGER